MTFTLGAKTLPNPKSFDRETIEVSSINTTIGGITKKRLQNRKEKYTLVYQNLTQSQANELMSEFELLQVRTFTVNETNLSIGPVDVLIDLPTREYLKTGLSYRENITIILWEVS